MGKTLSLGVFGKLSAWTKRKDHYRSALPLADTAASRSVNPVGLILATNSIQVQGHETNMIRCDFDEIIPDPWDFQIPISPIRDSILQQILCPY